MLMASEPALALVLISSDLYFWLTLETNNVVFVGEESFADEESESSRVK